MRLLHIMCGRGQGGAETYSIDMILSLHKAGIDQCVVMSERAPRYAEVVAAGVRVAPAVLKWPIRPLQKWFLKRLVAAEQPNLIHCWMRRAASLMPKIEHGSGCPVIGWFGGYYEPRHFKRCTHFVGVTRAIVDHMIERGVSPAGAFYIPTFPDIQDLPPVDRATLNTPESAPVFLALSRLHPKKGLDTLLRAVAMIPGVYLWLAGEGPLRVNLETLTADLNLEDRVRFLGWRTDRAALLRAADVCVLPSRYEPFGTVILEAWAAQTPLVACRSAGPVAHISDGKDGLLAAVDDHEDLARALRLVTYDKELRQRLIDNGTALYQKNFTREVVTQQMMALYRNLIDGEA